MVSDPATYSGPDAVFTLRYAMIDGTLNNQKMPRTAEDRVLQVLQTGLRTWDELKAATKLNDERLGFALSDLFDRRKVWTAQQGDVRVYGLERRTGLKPRFAHLRRRATD